MKKSKKILISMLAVLGVMLWILVYVLNIANKGRPENVQYPASGLTKSIFDSQNTTYTKQSYLGETYSLTNLPYTLDMPTAERADVGEGAVYYVPGKVYIYLLEILKTESETSYLKEEFGKAVMIDSIREKSILQNSYTDKGYLNGFSVKYLVDTLSVTNGMETAHAYMTVYRLITDNTYDHDFLIAVATLEESSGNYAACKEWMDGIIGSFQYSTELAESIASKKQKQSESQQEMIDMVSETMPEEEKAETDIPVKKVHFTLDKDYESALVTFEWTNEDSTVTILLKDANGSRYTPSTTAGNKAVFNLIRLKKGDWSFEVYGEYGDCSVHLYERDGYGNVTAVGQGSSVVTEENNANSNTENNNTENTNTDISSGEGSAGSSQTEDATIHADTSGNLVTVTKEPEENEGSAASSVVTEAEQNESEE
ncbi:MAG: hypothetical protein IJN92_03790 [Lachnospiraceae bacterium]|nr:hypothetical protein [Lachnospiraceae bacterium]